MHFLKKIYSSNCLKYELKIKIPVFFKIADEILDQISRYMAEIPAMFSKLTPRFPLSEDHPWPSGSPAAPSRPALCR